MLLSCQVWTTAVAGGELKNEDGAEGPARDLQWHMT